MPSQVSRRGVEAVRGTPRKLAPLAWYDVHLAGAAATTVADQMGGTAATLGSAAGADANDPLWLRHTGTDYLYLPGVAGNTVACTAPASTASYIATDTTGATSTGAATAGAFTLSTTGSWVRVELLDGGAVVLARFLASSSAQTGHTDTFGVVWTINRATTGRKASLVRGRGVLLLGTDDYVQVPNGAIPSLTATSNASFVIVGRKWATPAVNSRWLSNRVGSTTKGFNIYENSTTGAVTCNAQDGTVSILLANAAYTLGTVTVITAGRQGTTNVFIRVNNGTQVVSSAATLGDATGTGWLVGANPGPGNVSDMAFFALLTFSRVLTAGEIGQLVSYYQSGT